MRLQDYRHCNLEAGYDDGYDKLLLGLQFFCEHVIKDDHLPDVCRL